MTNEEALDWLDQFTNNIIQTDIDTRKRTFALQAITSIKTALEKQIPKKPIDDFSTHAIYDDDGNYLEQLDIITFRCPICNHILASGEINRTDCVEIHYCENCGQTLDWR